MFSRLFTVILSVAMLAGAVAISFAQDDLIQIAQWADEAEASSEYGSDDWSADQATGRPDVRACEDNAEAWASADYSDTETLTLYFDDAVIPTQVNVYQTLSPGSIVAIELIPEDDDDDPIEFEIEDPSDECPAVLSINLPDDLPEIIGVTLILEQDLVGYWNEIDAVELVGLVEGDEDDEEESSIEEGRYEDEYELFEVDADDSGDRGSRDDDDDDDDRGSAGDYDVPWGQDVECRDGSEIENGVELTIIQQRTGNQYRVTAVGIDGFDPVLAVMLTGEYDNALCSDDDSEAATYSADLPTTGDVDNESTSSQVIFNLNSANAFENVSIVVAGYGESSGEVLLIIEGMYASSADGIGDPMSLLISPALYESGVDPTAYMISVVSAFDPLMYVVNSNAEPVYDNDDNQILCDDAGNASLCWGDNDSLVGSYVSRSQNRELGGGQYDSMISFPLDEDFVGGYLNIVYTSYGSTEGDYVVAYHLGVEAED